MATRSDQEHIDAILACSQAGVVKVEHLPAYFKRIPKDERWRLYKAAGVVPAHVDAKARFLEEGLAILANGIPTSAVTNERQRDHIKRARQSPRGGFALIRRQQHVMKMAAFLELVAREPALTTKELADRAGTTTRTIQLWTKQLGLGGITCPDARRKAARQRTELSLSIRIGRN